MSREVEWGMARAAPRSCIFAPAARPYCPARSIVRFAMSLTSHLLRLLLILAIGMNAWAAPKHGFAMTGAGAAHEMATTAADSHEGCGGMDAMAEEPQPDEGCCAGDACQCECIQAFTIAPGFRGLSWPLPSSAGDEPVLSAIADTRLSRLNRPPIC